MLRTIAALLLYLGLASAALAQTAGPDSLGCNLTAPTGVLAAGTTQLVAGVSGKSISVCGFDVDVQAAGSFQLVFGTGSSCTTATNITHVNTIGSAIHIVDHIPTAFISGGSGQSACVVVTGTNPLAMTLYYSIN